MNVPKTPYEFDYDLWTTEDGKCMVRVKRTGEVTEVNRETFRFLRAEEKAFRRTMVGVPISGCEGTTATILSLNFVSCESGEDMEPAWLADPRDYTEEIIINSLSQSFEKRLTEREKQVFNLLYFDGKKQNEIACDLNVCESRISKITASIRRKAKIFFVEVSSF